jgi:DNA primase
MLLPTQRWAAYATNVLKVPAQDGDEWVSHCLSDSHTDRKPSARVNVAKGLWFCHGCGARGRLDDAHAKELTPNENLDEAEANLELTEQKVYPNSWLALYDFPHPYWRERGFTPEAITTFNLGFDPESGDVTIPLHDHVGMLTGVIRRNVEQKRYRYPFGVKVSNMLFNYHRATEVKELVITEGATDTIAAWEIGYDAVAVFGSNISETQAMLIHRLYPERVILAFDQDEAGHRATEKALECIRLPMSRLIWDPDLGKDLASLGAALRADIVANSQVPAEDLTTHPDMSVGS